MTQNTVMLINIKKACFYRHKEKLKTIQMLPSPTGYPAIHVSSISFFTVKRGLYFSNLSLPIVVSVLVCSSTVNAECACNINIDFIDIYV
jgi:hypothetical protein